MTLFDEDVENEDLSPEAAAQAPSSMWDSFTSNLAAAAGRSFVAKQYEAYNTVGSYLDEVSNAVGKDVKMDFYDQRLIGRLTDKEDTSLQYEFSNWLFGDVGANFDEKINALKAANPQANFQVKTFAQLKAEYQKTYEDALNALDEKAAKANQEGNFGATATGIVGGMAGFLTDPRNLLASIVPLGTVKNIATAVRAGAISGGLQTGIEIQDAEKFSGLSDEEQLKQSAANIAMATVAPGVLAGAGKIISKGAQYISDYFGLAGKDADSVAKAVFDKPLDKAADDILENAGDDAIARDVAFDMHTAHKLGATSPKDLLQKRQQLLDNYEDIKNGAVAPIKITSEMQEKINQIKVEDGSYFGRNPEFYAKNFDNLDDMEAALSYKPKNEEFGADVTAQQVAKDQEYARMLEEDEYLNTRFRSALEEDEPLPSLRPDTDLKTRQTRVEQMNEVDMLEGSIKQVATFTGDEYKGFGFTDDVFGIKADSTMGAQRFTEKVSSVKVAIQELKNCILGA